MVFDNSTNNFSITNRDTPNGTVNSGFNMLRSLKTRKKRLSINENPQEIQKMNKTSSILNIVTLPNSPDKTPIV